MSMKEILSDGNSGVNDDGDVVPLDHAIWGPQGEFAPDHYQGDPADTPLASDSGLPIRKRDTGASVRLVDRPIATEAI